MLTLFYFDQNYDQKFAEAQFCTIPSNDTVYFAPLKIQNVRIRKNTIITKTLVSNELLHESNERKRLYLLRK